MNRSRINQVFAMAAALALSIALVAAGASPAQSASRADETFGDYGVAQVDLPGEDQAIHMAVDPDGKIVLVGVTEDRVGVVRLTADGRRDRSFARDGSTLIQAGGYYPAGVVVRKDRSIVVALSLSEPKERFDVQAADDAGQRVLDGSSIALVRLRPNGSVDRSFGHNGFARSQTQDIRPLSDGAVSLAVAPDGSVVVLGARIVFSLGYFGGAYEPVLVRFTPSGEQDTSFGVGGVAPVAPGAIPVPVDVVVQRDGRIVVGAILWDTALAFTTDWMFYRYLPSGLPDPAFGVAGVDRQDVSDAYGWDFLDGMLLQPDGKIVAYGQSGGLLSGGGRATVARLRPDGGLDRSFGTSGVLKLRDLGALSQASAAALQPDGRIVLAAFVLDDDWEQVLVRAHEDGTLDGSFGRPEVPLEYVSDIGIQAKRVIATGRGGAPYFYRDGFIAAAFRR